jgi:hypothetical protein
LDWATGDGESTLSAELEGPAVVRFRSRFHRPTGFTPRLVLLQALPTGDEWQDFSISVGPDLQVLNWKITDIFQNPVDAWAEIDGVEVVPNTLPLDEALRSSGLHWRTSP